MNNCSNCLEKDIKIYDLTQKVEHLKKIIQSQKKKSKKGAFGSSTPSSKIPIKENTKVEMPNKNGGGKIGHKGHGKKKVSEETADKIEYLFNEKSLCPECSSELERKGYQDRTVIDSENKKPEKILYHWVDDRKVPPDNNTAERELCPTIISRKVSFGSQSEAGAETRSTIMSYLHTARKRIKDKPIEKWFKEVLDKIAENPNINCYELLKSENIY